MPNSNVQKIARVLNILVSITFICNLLALLLVPTLVRQAYVSPYLYQELLWDQTLVWKDPQAVALIFFLWFSGICTAVILWQGRRVLRTILQGAPFSLENAISLRRAAVSSFVISTAALARLIFSICYYRSLAPLLSYNALFVPIFAMAGLLCLVMSALFRQAAEMKAENDLTI